MTVKDMKWKDFDTIRVVESDAGPRLVSPAVPDQDVEFPFGDLLVKDRNEQLIRLRSIPPTEYPHLRVIGNSPYLYSPSKLVVRKTSAEVRTLWPEDIPELADAPILRKGG